MGLQTWPNDKIRKQDVAISKNYLAEAEIRELNRLTMILLDIFEDQLDLGRLVVMQDAQNLLERQLEQLGRSVLRHGGSVKAMDAKRAAEKQYEKFDLDRKLQRQKEAEQLISSLASEVKKLPKTPRR
ncbi:Virulence protein RhuM family protein [Mesorhizobium sp. YR577]|nr:Virulence protein RhuM family protein [Mesorhizobium sp. YR577]